MINSDEKDEYVLTPAEEEMVVAHAIKRKKEYAEWKMRDIGMKQFEIDAKISTIDFVDLVDRKQVLEAANSNRLQELWMRGQREKERLEEIQKAEELKKEWTAKRMYSLMRWSSKNKFGKDFILNEDNKHFVTTLCFFLSGDPRFESVLGYSFNKGLLIRGTPGIGKTFLVQCVAENALNQILILSMIEISDEIKNYGEYEIIIGKNKIIYLDDVGTEEPTVNHYGTKINYFKQFIEQCYLRNRTFNRLMVSTNNGFSELESKYGFRVRSRIKDMFNVVDVKGGDMRGRSQ